MSDQIFPPFSFSTTVLITTQQVYLFHMRQTKANSLWRVSSWRKKSNWPSVSACYIRMYFLLFFNTKSDFLHILFNITWQNGACFYLIFVCLFLYPIQNLYLYPVSFWFGCWNEFTSGDRLFSMMLFVTFFVFSENTRIINACSSYTHHCFLLTVNNIFQRVLSLFLNVSFSWLHRHYTFSPYPISVKY